MSLKEMLNKVFGNQSNNTVVEDSKLLNKKVDTLNGNNAFDMQRIKEALNKPIVGKVDFIKEDRVLVVSKTTNITNAIRR